MRKRVRLLSEFEEVAFSHLRERGHFSENEDWYQWYFWRCLQLGGYRIDFKSAVDRAMSEYFSYIRSFA